MHSLMLVGVATAGGAARAGARGSSDSAVAFLTFAFLTFLMLISLGGLVVRFLAPSATRSQEDEDSDSGSGGGAGPRRPERPPSPGGGPVWWPEFERQFAAHVRSRSQEGRRPRELNTCATAPSALPLGALGSTGFDVPVPVSGFPYPGASVNRR